MRPMTDDKPISWMALEAGTPVVASDGEEVGRVTDVIADRQKDIFSGINLKHGVFGSQHFVPADTIEEITGEEVRLSITAAEAEKLETP